MGAFTAIDVARTGLGFNHYWTEVISHNVANANTATRPDDEPFRQRYVIARANTTELTPTGSGVHVADLVEDSSDAALYTAVGHPLADEHGRVQAPVVDLAGQLTDLIIAQRGYQANTKVVHSAREAYASALRIGER